MYLAFPADEKVKARLDVVCKSLNIPLEEWFETVLKASEFGVLVKFLDKSRRGDCLDVGRELMSICQTI